MLSAIVSRRTVTCAFCRASQRSFIQARNASASTKAAPSDLDNPTPIAEPSKPSPAPKNPISSCEPGTVLKGLGYLANKPEPVALKDDEYPSWLWKLLDPQTEKRTGSSTPGVIDKRELRKKNRENIRSSNFFRAQ